MFPVEVFRSEASAANLLEQVRWREGLQCPRCQSESVIKYGSYREYQRYRCKNCERTFNDKTGTIFARVISAADEFVASIFSVMTAVRRFEVVEHLSNTELKQAIEEAQKADETRLVRRLCFIKNVSVGDTNEMAARRVGASQPTGGRWLKA